MGSRGRGAVDCSVRIWDLASGQCTTTLEGHADWVTCVAFSPVDKRVVASSSADGTAIIW